MSQDQLWTQGSSDASADYWVDRMESLGRYKGPNMATRAPYKPLLLLWMIGRVASGQPSSVSFKEAEQAVSGLFGRYRYRDKPGKPQYPFIYLGTDAKLWTVEDSRGKDITKLPSKVKQRVTFLREEAVGALTPEFELALHDAGVRTRVVNKLLEVTFPETLHEEVLSAVNLTSAVKLTPLPRDPAFRSSVLLAYENRCSFCGFEGTMMGQPLGIDAAHVQMRSHRGPDRVDNGLALCVLHHRLFDRGALGLDPGHRILVSQYVMLREEEAPVPVKTLVGRPIRQPQGGYDAPAAAFITWHRRNLFVGPERQRAG